METTTHREYLTWMAYFGEEWNNPDRSDYYLMQISADIRAIFEKNVTLESAKIPFKPASKKKRKVRTKADLDRETALAKAAWAMRLGGPKGKPK